MGNGKSFEKEKNIEEGINTVIKKLNDFIGHTGYYEGCEEDIYSPMQEILNEFIEINNSNSSNDVNILQKFENIGSLEEIKKQESELSKITKKLKENIEKLKKFKTREICQHEFDCEYSSDSNSDSDSDLDRYWDDI